MSKWYIGIDPGVNTGLAQWDGAELVIDTMGFWSLVRWMDTHDLKGCTIVIEDPNLIRPTFQRDVGRNAMLRIAQNVGSNKRDAQLLIEYAESLGLEVRRVKPTTAKWDAGMLARITGYTGRTSQHGRDAAKLVYGL
jgi:hypothetical protein